MSDKALEYLSKALAVRSQGAGEAEYNEASSHCAAAVDECIRATGGEALTHNGDPWSGLRQSLSRNRADHAMLGRSFHYPFRIERLQELAQALKEALSDE